jgi:hypothetical protein
MGEYVTVPRAGTNPSRVGVENLAAWAAVHTLSHRKSKRDTLATVGPSASAVALKKSNVLTFGVFRAAQLMLRKECESRTRLSFVDRGRTPGTTLGVAPSRHDPTFSLTPRGSQ